MLVIFQESLEKLYVKTVISIRNEQVKIGQRNYGLSLLIVLIPLVEGL